MTIGLIILTAVIATVLLAFLGSKFDWGKSKEPNVITVSTLEKIINVSELSTFTAVYNGIAKVMNEKDSEQIDYYVSYEARVNAGIDFSKIKIEVDNEKKTIIVELPEVSITKINVDISTLDFIFYNKKADTSTVTQTAYRACEADVQEESAKQTAILELAQQNAVNIVTALVNPFIAQIDAEYTLTVK